MKRLALLALLVGCGSSSPAAGDGAAPWPDAGTSTAPTSATAPDGVTFMVGWDLMFVGSDARITCAQADTLVVSLRVTPTTGGSADEFRVRCSQGAVTAKVPAPGRYQVRIELRGAHDRAVSSIEGAFDLPRGTTDLGVVTFQLRASL